MPLLSLDGLSPEFDPPPTELNTCYHIFNIYLFLVINDEKLQTMHKKTFIFFYRRPIHENTAHLKAAPTRLHADGVFRVTDTTVYAPTLTA